MNPEALLAIKNVTKRFGGLTAVNNVSLHVRKGEVLGIIGSNGSGKTTLINMISGFLKPDQGTIELEGEDITGLPAHRVTAKGISRTFQMLRPFYSVPACHNVTLALLSPRSKRIRHIRKSSLAEQIAMDLMELVGFDRSRDSFRPTRMLTPGYLRRLDIARAIASEPLLLLADEPFSELTSTEATSVGPALTKLNSLGTTIVLIEHRLQYIWKMVHRVIVMHQGEILAEGPPEEIVHHEKLKAYYE